MSGGRNVANELQSLSQLFQNKLFRIPDYQRGYAWQQAQLIDFWDDLINLQNDRYHYTGLLSLKLLSRKETVFWGSDLWMLEKGFKPCHIVDGQQRLTTFIILLNEIISFVHKLEENDGKSEEEIVLEYDTLKDIVTKYIYQKRPPNNMITTYLFGYEVDNPSEEYLRYKIFKENFSGTVNETYYTKNLEYAKKFFADNIADFYQAEGINGIGSIYHKLTQQLMFNIHEIDDDYDVFVAFETMNNRGKKLTNLELLKNRLIYLTTLYNESKFDDEDKKELRKQINDAWKEIYYQLGRNQNTSLSDDEFLRAHWITYFTYSRKKGDDYIRFLLQKFSAKNIFEKRTIFLKDAPQDARIDEDIDVEDNINDNIVQDSEAILKLEPEEISNYVNSLKDMAKYWYDTFFPYESQILDDEEKLWIDRLNRIGIGYFRPLVTAVSSKASISVEEKISLFKAIERFIFICFRLGIYNATFCSSDYNRAAHKLYSDKILIQDLTSEINETADLNMEYASSSFVNKTQQRFSAGDGYYGWNSLKYFMYEYEYSLTSKNGIKKITWELFSKVEKDKVSIEHILPQTPTKLYWQNQFRQFTSNEVKLLSGALGNLLPLSQHVNSGLQNDSFNDKKTSKSNGRRGYENGSHSEIEVSKEPEWNGEKIYDRSINLIEFLSKRWRCTLSKEQKEKLAYVNFVNDGRSIPEVFIGEDSDEIESLNEQAYDLGTLQEKFWRHFVDYCTSQGREQDIASRKPFAQNWYDVPVGARDFILSYTVTRSKYISILIYVYEGEAFERLEQKKTAIENAFGDNLDWYSSPKNSVAKRIIYKKEADIFDESKKEEIFDWMIEIFDRLKKALVFVEEFN